MMSLVLYAKSLLWCEAAQVHEDHAFLYVEVMWRESGRSEHVPEFHGKSGGTSRITCTVST